MANRRRYVIETADARNSNDLGPVRGSFIFNQSYLYKSRTWTATLRERGRRQQPLDGWDVRAFGAGFGRGRTFSEASRLAFDVEKVPVTVPDTEEHVGNDAHGGRADHCAGNGRLEQSADQQVHVVDGRVQLRQLVHVLNKGLYVIDLRNQPRLFYTRVCVHVLHRFRLYRLSENGYYTTDRKKA